MIGSPKNSRTWHQSRQSGRDSNFDAEEQRSAMDRRDFTKQAASYLVKKRTSNCVGLRLDVNKRGGHGELGLQ